MNQRIQDTGSTPGTGKNGASAGGSGPGGRGSGSGPNNRDSRDSRDSRDGHGRRGNQDSADNRDNSREIARQVARRLSGLERERKKGWESHWRDLAANFMPRRARFLDAGDATNDGDVKNHLQDDVGILALRTLASGMQSGLTSPARPWFSLSLQHEALTQNRAVREWLHQCYAVMTNVFARSNFYDQIHMLYRELGTFGTGVMLVEEDIRSGIRCRTLTIGEFCLDVDAASRVDTLYRRVRMTPRQIVEAWPDTAPARVHDQARQDAVEWLDVIHAIEPNPHRQPGRLAAAERPWRSVYLLAGGNEVLEISGFYEFPALCPRWDTTAADVYGTSPAMDALGDCRMLQKITEDGRIALEKEVNPPLLVAEGNGIDGLDVSPGALNYTSSLAQGQSVVTSLYQVRSNLAGLENTRAQLKQQIRELFFNDLFMMLSQVNRQMTATEVAERNAEKMLMLGPVLDRLRSELFQPLIERVFGVLCRAGLMPPPPVDAAPELAGQEIRVEFISILAQAQKQAGIAAINQTVGFVGQLAQLMQNPAVLDKINADEAVDEVAQMQGVPPRLIRSDEEVEQLRAERAQQAQQMQQMQMMQQGLNMAAQGARAVKDMGGLPREAPHAGE